VLIGAQALRGHLPGKEMRDMPRKGSSKSSGSRKASTSYRSAKTGRFVRKSYANRHKGTTVKETDKKK
jgi:hypothetical protein